MTPKDFAVSYTALLSLRGVCRRTGITYSKAHKLYREAVSEGLLEPRPASGRRLRAETKRPPPAPEGRLRALETRVLSLPSAGQVARHIFTCAQNSTKLHGPFWQNLLALAGHYGASIHVSRFTYVKQGLGARGDKAQATKTDKGLYDDSDLRWDPALDTFLSDARIEVAPGLVWCGEMNILPTAVRPLSGLETYTGRKSAIFPHVKIAMDSVPSGKHEATKLIYTTGTVTQRNYIQRKAGLKAEFHHCYGGILAEVDSAGDWFCRQLNGDSEGVIHDLDVRVDCGRVTTDNSVKAINWGDIHVRQIDPTVKQLAWEDGGMLDTLCPTYQFMHDVLDFRSRSHHDAKDPHRLFRRHVDGEENVAEECREVAEFLAWSRRSWCRTMVVDSNHHQHLGRWLREKDGRWDPVNVQFWLRMQESVYRNLAEKKELNYLRLAVQISTDDTWGIKFLDEDESFIVCPDANGGIQCGMHGDLGPDGSRGTPAKLTKTGRKANTGHTHKAQIVDGIYVAGTSGTLAPDWVKGPSSWSHSHIVTYDNGKRAIITMWNGKWRAKQQKAA